MGRIHYVKLEMAAVETAVAFDNRSFGLSLFTKKKESIKIKRNATTNDLFTKGHRTTNLHMSVKKKKNNLQI